MNRRSAMIVSAGLIVALVAGVYALVTGVTSPATSASAKDSKPKAITNTVTVHKHAPSSSNEAAMSAPLLTRDGGGAGTESGDRSHPSDEPAEAHDKHPPEPKDEHKPPDPGDDQKPPPDEEHKP